MDFPKVLENPVVLLGGAAVGLFLLMSGKASATSSTDASSAGPSAAVIAYNTAGLAAVTQQYQDQTELAKTVVAGNVTEQLAAYQTLQNMQNTSAVVKQAEIASNTGIVQAAISSSTAITVDQQNNTNRLGLAYVTLAQQKDADNASVTIAQEQAKAAKNASTMGLIGQVVGAVASVAAAPFTGGASLAGLAALAKSGNIPTNGSSGADPVDWLH